MKRFTGLICLLLCSTHATAEVLQDIRFVGNDTTRPEIMLQEMTIEVGDEVDVARIEESRQAIMNLGLFKEVSAELQQEVQGTVLLITVDEKWYILPIPRVGAKPDGEADYGLELRLDNLFGLNQRLKLLYLNKESLTDDKPLKREMSVGYTYPRMFGTPYQLDASAGVVRQKIKLLEGDVETGSYLYDNKTLKLGLYRWHNERGPSRGLRYGGGVGLQRHDYSELVGSASDYADRDNAYLNGVIEYVDMQEEKYRRKGEVYGYNVEVGMPQWGDYSYHKHLLSYRRYLPLDKSRANLNYRIQLGLANSAAFGGQSYALGSSTSLRGYEGDYVTGNAMALVNVEYLYPLTGSRQLRGVVFVDAGNAYPGVEEADLLDLKAAVGLGLRWKFQLFVDVTLRADFAWGLESKEQMTYLDTSTVF